MVNAKYNIFATTMVWKNINNDTLTLRVKCYNGVSKHLRILSVIIKLYHESGFFLGAVVGDGINTPISSDTTRKRTIGTYQKYHLLFHPVLIRASVPGATRAGTF